MKIEAMRRLDYWIGIPLCFLVTIFNCIFRLFFYKKKEGAVKKILFIKLPEIGAVILALPLIMEIIKNYPNGEIFFLTFKSTSPLMEALDIVPQENILTIREDSFILFLSDAIKAVKKMRREKLDVIFDLEFFSRVAAVLTGLSGAGRKIGFYKYTFEGLYRGNILTHKVLYNPLLHTSKMYLSLASLAELKKKSTPDRGEIMDNGELVLPKLNLNAQQKEEIWNRLSEFQISKGNRLLLLSPGEGDLPLREWPLENFIILSKLLLRNSENYIIVVGNKSSKKADKLSHTLNHKRCINLAGETTILELLCLFEIADSLIVNDSGLAHLASFTPLKTAVLFGPESPCIFKPLGKNIHIIYRQLPCSPCFSVLNHRRSVCKDNKCLKLIKPEEVYSLIKNKPDF